MELSKEIMDFLEKEFNLFEVLNDADIEKFYTSIKYYFVNVKDVDEFKKNVKETILFFDFIELSSLEMLYSITNSPYIIEIDKKLLLNIYLMLGKMVHPIIGLPDRHMLLVEQPFNFFVDINIIYAKVMFFLSKGEERAFITMNKLFVLSDENFYEMYHLTIDDILKKYPYSEEKMNEILEWEENERLRNKILERESR